jgi:hypothetical protein
MALQTKKELFLVWSYLVDVRTAALIIRGDIALRKTAFLSHLYVKTIILPRQARDKHRENSKKEAVFPTSLSESSSSSSPPPPPAFSASAARGVLPGVSSPSLSSSIAPLFSSSSLLLPPTARKRSVFEFSLCLPRVCRGKMFVLYTNG